MSDQEILQILKMDLQISTDKQDNYLSALITTAQEFIKKEGVTLTDSVEDGMLTEMYAAYLHRKRREAAPMPDMIRWNLINRLLSEKGKEK